jgi:hypothetical protein
VSNSRNSVEALLRNLDHGFKMWCPKCKSTSVHLSEERGRWSLEVEYTFACYTCGLRKYGEGVIYGLIMDMRQEWGKTSKDREAEKARKAEEDAQKAKIQEAIAKHQAEQRVREIEERRKAEIEERRRHREWLEQVQTGQLARPFAAPPPPKPKPTPPPVETVSPKERTRIREAAYREANRERRRENDRLRRARLRADKVQPVVDVAIHESAAEQAKQRKRERDARYRASKKVQKSEVRVDCLPPPPVIIVPELAVPRANKCAWVECDNEPEGKSKYCSRVCSNKNAHAREMSRKRSG